MKLDGFKATCVSKFGYEGEMKFKVRSINIFKNQCTFEVHGCIKVGVEPAWKKDISFILNYDQPVHAQCYNEAKKLFSDAQDVVDQITLVKEGG